MKTRVLRILTAADHFVFAVITLGNCRPYEMISSALWAMEQNGRFLGRVLRPAVDFMFSPVQSDHCMQSWLWQKDLYK